MWSAMYFRLDLTQSVTILTHFCSNLSLIHVTLIKQMFYYIADTINKGLVFRENDISDDIKDYTDSDFTGVRMSHKFTSDYVFNLADAAISHLFKLQVIITLSICEAEYIAMCETGKKAVWLSCLLRELRYCEFTSVLLKADNQRAIALTKNPEFHCWIKHINVQYHWIHEAVKSGHINIEYILTKEMTADRFIKSLLLQAFQAFLHLISISDMTTRERDTQAGTWGEVLVHNRGLYTVSTRRTTNVVNTLDPM